MHLRMSSSLFAAMAASAISAITRRSAVAFCISATARSSALTLCTICLFVRMGYFRFFRAASRAAFQPKTCFDVMLCSRRYAVFASFVTSLA